MDMFDYLPKQVDMPALQARGSHCEPLTASNSVSTNAQHAVWVVAGVAHAHRQWR